MWGNRENIKHYKEYEDVKKTITNYIFGVQLYSLSFSSKYSMTSIGLSALMLVDELLRDLSYSNGGISLNENSSMLSIDGVGKGLN